MKSGDIVVMMSDGCVSDDEDSMWLTQMLCETKVGEDSEAFADNLRDKILYGAKLRAKEKNVSDDISVGVIIVV